MDVSLTDEQRALVVGARALADGPFHERAAGYDREERWPAENVADLVRAGFMDMVLPAEKGGQDRSGFETVLVALNKILPLGIDRHSHSLAEPVESPSDRNKPDRQQ